MIHPNDKVYALEMAVGLSEKFLSDAKVTNDLRELLAEARKEARSGQANHSQPA